MIYIAIVLLIIMLISSVYKEKNIYNPMAVFSLVWIWVLVLASFKLYNMVEYTNKSIFVLTLGFLGFGIGYFISTINKKNVPKMKNTRINNTSNEMNENAFNWKLIRILVCVGVILTMILSIKVMFLIINGTDYSLIRNMYYSYGKVEPLIKSEQLFTFYDWGTSILLMTLVPIVLVSIFEKNIDIFSTIGTAIMVALYIFSTSGRMQLIYIIIEITILLLIYRNKISKKAKKYLLILGLVLVMIVLAMTAIRTKNSKEGSVNTIYSYFSIPVPMFSHWVEYIDGNGISTNGVSGVYGAYLAIQKSVKVFGGYKFKNADYLFKIMNAPQNNWLDVFKGSPDLYNAYSTMFYNFYADFGIVGVMLETILYAWFVSWFYNKYKMKKNSRYTVIYLMLVLGVFTSFINWQFAGVDIWFSIPLVYLITRKKKIKETAEVKKNNSDNDTSRILVFGMTENPGGMESVIMNYYRNINRKKIQFDFLCNSKTVAYEDEIIDLGGEVYKITARSENYKKYKREIKEFFENNSNKYSTIWVNSCSLANIDYLIYAKKYGIKYRIIHSHNSQNMDSKLRKLLHMINKIFVKWYATDFWTCSEVAGKWFFGKKIRDGEKYLVVNNAIDCELYSYNEEIRNEYREKLGIQNNVVIGNVGRLHFQKNQLFLLDIFYNIYMKDDRFSLIMVGTGDDYDKILEKIKTLNLCDCVKLLGVRDDVEKIYQSMDVLVFPSLFEGLPLTLVEAQANGMPIYASDTISKKINMSNNFKFVSLNRTPKEWADIIINDYNNGGFKRKDNISMIREKGYDIVSEAMKIEKYFERN